MVRAQVRQNRPSRPRRVNDLRVEPGEQVHATLSGDCYLRIGDESRRLSYAQRQALEYERGNGPFDGKPTNAEISDLDPKAMKAYQDSIGSFTLDGMLHARSLLTTGQIATLASMTNPTAGRHLKALAEAGLVERSGGAPRDRYATWAATNDQTRRQTAKGE